MTASKMAHNKPASLEWHTCVIPYHILPWLICIMNRIWQKSLPRLGFKTAISILACLCVSLFPCFSLWLSVTLCNSLFLFLIADSGETYIVSRHYEEAHLGREWSLLLTATWVHIPLLVKSSETTALDTSLTTTSQKTLSQNHAVNLLLVSQV